MKKLLLLLLCVPLIGFGQKISVEDILCIGMTLRQEMKQEPMWEDCTDKKCTQQNIRQFISKNFKFPEIAKGHNLKGRMIVEHLKVNRNGETSGFVNDFSIEWHLNSDNLYSNLSKKEEKKIRKKFGLKRKEVQSFIDNLEDNIFKELYQEMERVFTIMPIFEQPAFDSSGRAIYSLYTITIQITP